MTEITIFKEPITLGQFLKFSGLISTGGEVKIFLEESDISVNNIAVNRRGKKLFSGDLVEINGQKFKLRLENDN